VMLPSENCADPVCLDRRRYSAKLSSTAVDINANGTLVDPDARLAGDEKRRDAIQIGVSSMNMGDGGITGELMYDRVCISTGTGRAPTCSSMGIAAAKKMTEVPFAGFPHDGIIGLGLENLHINELFSFNDRFAKGSPWLPHRFGMFFGNQTGEIAFGGHNDDRMTGHPTWAPVVNTNEGYWQVALKAVRVANSTLDDCKHGHCRIIVDSCASGIGVPNKMVPAMSNMLLAAKSMDGFCTGPDLHLDLDGGTLTLKAADYAGSKCDPSITALDLPEQFEGVFIIGEVLLQRYYTIFDWENTRIGFADPVRLTPEQEAIELASMEALPQAEHWWMSEFQSLALLLLLVLVVQYVAFVFVTYGSNHALFVKIQSARLRLLLARMGILSSPSDIAVAIPVDEVPEGEECSICLGSCEDDCSSIDTTHGCDLPLSAKKEAVHWCKLRCGHIFHESCIFRWLSRTPRCPVCRRYAWVGASSKEGETISGIALSAPSW